MNSMAKRALVAISLVAILLLPSAVKIGSFFFDTLFVGDAIRDVRRAQDALYPKTIDDLAAWNQSELARDLSSRDRDAGPALNRRLEWKGDLAGFELEPTTGAPDGAALIAACENFPACEPQAYEALGLATDAFDLFSQAMEFDHWNVNHNSPIEATAKSGRMAADSRKPLPDLRRVQGLARAYMFSATKSRDANAALAAFQHVVHMAKLLMTQQTVEGAATGVQLLRDARAAATAIAATDKRLEAAPSAMPSEEDLQRFERLTASVPSFFAPLTEPAHLDSLLTADRMGAFTCIGAARQFSPENSALLAYAEPTAPGETDYRPYVSVAAKMLAPSSPCPLPFEKEAWARREDIRLAELESTRGVPWLRRSYFLLRALTSAAEAAPQVTAMATSLNQTEAPPEAPAETPSDAAPASQDPSVAQ